MVRLMSDRQLLRLEVLRDLDQRRLTVEAAAQLPRLERRHAEFHGQRVRRQESRRSAAQAADRDPACHAARAEKLRCPTSARRRAPPGRARRRSSSRSRRASERSKLRSRPATVGGRGKTSAPRAPLCCVGARKPSHPARCAVKIMASGGVGPRGGSLSSDRFVTAVGRAGLPVHVSESVG
jgi:hypothetical protein